MKTVVILPGVLSSTKKESVMQIMIPLLRDVYICDKRNRPPVVGMGVVAAEVIAAEV